MSAVALVLAPTIAITASPYLAGLTLTASQRDNRRWWRPTRASWTRTSVVAATAAALAILGAEGTRWTAAWPAYLALSLSGAVMIVIDTEQHRLPDRMTATAALIGAGLLAAAAAIDHTWLRLGRVGLAAAVVLAVFYAMALISPKGVGLGDVKLAAVLAGHLAWFSWLTVLAGLAAGILIAGITSIGLLATRRATRSTHIPLGPFLITAAFLIAALRP